MTEILSVLAAQRAEDADLCEWLRERAIGDPLYGYVADRIEQLNQELREACHDRDRLQADLERPADDPLAAAYQQGWRQWNEMKERPLGLFSDVDLSMLWAMGWRAREKYEWSLRQTIARQQGHATIRWAGKTRKVKPVDPEIVSRHSHAPTGVLT